MASVVAIVERLAGRQRDPLRLDIALPARALELGRVDLLQQVEAHAHARQSASTVERRCRSIGSGPKAKTARPVAEHAPGSARSIARRARGRRCPRPPSHRPRDRPAPMSIRVQPSGSVTAKPLSATSMRPVVARLAAGGRRLQAAGEDVGGRDRAPGRGCHGRRRGRPSRRRMASSRRTRRAVIARTEIVRAPLRRRTVVSRVMGGPPGRRWTAPSLGHPTVARPPSTVVRRGAAGPTRRHGP